MVQPPLWREKLAIGALVSCGVGAMRGAEVTGGSAATCVGF